MISKFASSTIHIFMYTDANLFPPIQVSSWKLWAKPGPIMHHNQTIMVQVVPTPNPQALLLFWLHLPAGEHDHRGQRLEYRRDRRLSLLNWRKGLVQIRIRRIQMFWASWIRIRIHHYLYGSGFGPFHQQAKKVTKTLISTFLWLGYDFFSLKADVNVPSKSIEPKNFIKKIFFVGKERFGS
jgi:hypothetical protein